MLCVLLLILCGGEGVEVVQGGVDRDLQRTSFGQKLRDLIVIRLDWSQENEEEDLVYFAHTPLRQLAEHKFELGPLARFVLILTRLFGYISEEVPKLSEYGTVLRLRQKEEREAGVTQVKLDGKHRVPTQ